MIDHYVEANNLGTTHILRSFSPCSATAAGCWWWRAGPAACARWRRRCIRGSKTCNRWTMSTARSATGATRCAPVARRQGLAGLDQHSVQDRPGRSGARARRPAPSRGFAARNPDRIDLAGVDRYRVSRAWLDLTGAPQPDEVAGPLLDFALDPSPHQALYGELVHVGREEPGPFGSVVRSGSIVPWK